MRLAPDSSWELRGSCAKSFEESSQVARGLMKVAPTGFELDLAGGEKRVQFSVDSVEHLMNWLEELRLAASPALNRLSRAEEVDMQQVDESKLFDLFAERERPDRKNVVGEKREPRRLPAKALFESCRKTGAVNKRSPSNNLSFSVVETGTPDANRLRRRLMLSVGVSEGEEEDEPPPLVERVSSEEEQIFKALCLAASAKLGAAPNALSQLRHLEVEMTGVVDKWSRTLAATEAGQQSQLTNTLMRSGERLPWCPLSADIALKQQYRWVKDGGCQSNLRLSAEWLALGYTSNCHGTDLRDVDCRALLRFFGLGSGSSSDAEGARQLLQALSAFQGQVRTAWAELDQHAAKAKTRGTQRLISRYIPGGLRLHLCGRASADRTRLAMKGLNTERLAKKSCLKLGFKAFGRSCRFFALVGPQHDELQGLAEKNPLRDIEREILPLAQLTRLRERLRLPGIPRPELSLFKTLDERLADAMQQLCLVQSACTEVRQASVLRTGLRRLRSGSLLQIIVVLFNYINYGPALSWVEIPKLASPVHQCQGPESNKDLRNVDVQSLTHLVETQSFGGPFPKFNMLHFCGSGMTDARFCVTRDGLQELVKQFPDLTQAQLDDELSSLSGASYVNLSSVNLRTLALERLKEDLKFVQTELYGHRQEYQKKDPEEAPSERSSMGPVNFDLEENDTASEEELVQESSEDTLANLSPRKSVIGRLVCMGIDTWSSSAESSFAEDWCQGSAIVGVNEEAGHLQAALAADGEVPPPGVMWRWRPSGGRWKPYFCEVRGALLVLYRVKTSTAKLRGTFYVVLPGAEVALLDSLYATQHARELARQGEHPHGLELRPVGNRVEYLLTKTAKAARPWSPIWIQSRLAEQICMFRSVKSNWQDL
ncbi:unnamed protein product [Effrenium voratum]|nr:unnamed protein product [Effrenium voratum]